MRCVFPGGSGTTTGETTIHHIEGVVDPVADAQVVNLELLLADLEHVQRRLEKKTCGGLERETLIEVEQKLSLGIPARDAGLHADAQFAIKSMGLLTLKPVLYCFNVDEVDFTLNRAEALEQAQTLLQSILNRPELSEKDLFTIVSARLETELAEKSVNEQLEYLDGLGMNVGSDDAGSPAQKLLSHHVLPTRIRELLDLDVVYTGPGVPPERSRTTKAHLFRRGALTADDLADRLHGDLQKGFIRAEVVPAPRLLECGSYGAAKTMGQVRGEGRDYVLADQDVILIKWKG